MSRGSFLRITNAPLEFVGSSNTAGQKGGLHGGGSGRDTPEAHDYGRKRPQGSGLTLEGRCPKMKPPFLDDFTSGTGEGER